MATIKRDKLPPCKKDGVDCPKRQVGCHSTCQEFIDWEKEHVATREARRAEKTREHVLNSYFIPNTVNRELRWQMYKRRH